MINASIFKAYDIRAVYEPGVLDTEAAILVGKGFGTWVKDMNENTVIVGHDNRKSSEELNKNLIQGLTSTGTNVIDIGLVTTPILFYSRKLFDIGPAIMITASHSPKEYNGFKICLNKSEESIYGDKIQDLIKFIEAGNFATGEGSVTHKNIIEDYINNVCEKVKLGNRKIKAVVDCGNGSASILAVELMERLGVEVIPLYCDSNPDFPNHHPDPSVPSNLKDACELVVKEKADVGIAFDGDSDRIGIIDEKGEVLLGDQFMTIIWRDIMKKYPGSEALIDIKCSQSLVDEVVKLGGKPIYIRTGNPFIKAAMRKRNIPFSGEMSGHIFFADEYYGFDDGTYAAARFLRILSNTDKKVSQLLDGVNKYYSTPEETIRIDDEKEKLAFVENIKKYFQEKGYKIIAEDGARVLFEDGWGLVRSSNTSPLATLRFEGKTPESLERIKQEFQEAINSVKK